MKEDQQVYDITIIGGGPTGLFTAFYAGMRKASVKIIESLPHLGGQLSALYPEKLIYDVAGFPKVPAQELIDQLKKQMDQFQTTVCLKQTVQTVEKLDDYYFTLTTDKEIHYTKTIIITAGNGAFQPRRLQVNHAALYEGKHLHYLVNDLQQFANKNVAVLGGGDSAVDWALMLEPIVNKVTIVHRRKQFRAHEHSVEKLVQSNVEVKTPFIPTDIIGDGNSIQQLIIKESKSDKKEVLHVDDILVNYGFVSSLGSIKDWGLNIEKNAIVVNQQQETNIPGIYAAGDVCTYKGKIKLIATGFGEAPTAVSNAKAAIDPKARLQPMHSTAMFSS